MRFTRPAFCLVVICALFAPMTSRADPMPVYACGGVAPQTYSCSNPQHDVILTALIHGSTIPVTPAYVGRLHSRIIWTNKKVSGWRSYWCDFKDPQDYADGPNPLGAPNCHSAGTVPPWCVETAPTCAVKYRQVCSSTNYRVNTGKGSGPWECDNTGI